MTDWLAVATPTIYFLISILTLGTFMYKIGGWINKRADEKAIIVKTKTEEVAAALKRSVEERADQLRKETDSIVGVLKTEADARGLEQSQTAIKNFTASISMITELGHKVELIDEKVTNKIDLLDTKLMGMIDNLSKRSDLVNGNIANIRTDIADLQDDIAELSMTKESPMNAKTRMRSQRLKRRRIEADRIAQQEG